MSDRLDARIRELTFRLIDMSPEAPPFPEEPMVQLRPSPTTTRAPRPGPRPRLAWALAGAAAVIAAIAIPAFLLGGPTEEPVDTVSTTLTLPTTTSTPPTSPPAGLDLSGAAWITHGLDGIRRDDGTLLWETQPFPTGLARDGEGGFAFTDSVGLWWFPAGAAEPEFVQESLWDLISVVPSESGPVALVLDTPVYEELDDGTSVLISDGRRYVRLSDGAPVSDPGGGPEMVPPDKPWLWKRTAANGLSAWITDPEVLLDAESYPTSVVEPAHLLVARGDETLFDLQIGTEQDAWARIHDFDGRTLIVSRGPYEPAMPEETFFVIDLACGDCVRTFSAAATVAALPGGDVDWTGPVETPLPTEAAPRSFTIDPSTATPVDLPPAEVTQAGWGNGEFDLGLSPQGFGPCCFDVVSDGGVVFLDSENQRLMHWLPGGNSTFPLATFSPAEFVADALAVGRDDRIYVLGMSNRPGRPHDLLIIGLDGSVDGPYETVVDSNADLQATVNGIYAGGVLIDAEPVDGWIPVVAADGTPVPRADQHPVAELPVDDRSLRIGFSPDGSISATLQPEGDGIPVEYRIPSGYFLVGSFLQSQGSGVVLVLGTQWTGNSASDFLIVQVAVEGETAVSEVYRIPGAQWAQMGAFGTVRLEGSSLYFMSTIQEGPQVARYELPG